MLDIEYTLETIDNAAGQILKHATSKKFLFKADMGAGKTTLIKALVKALGCHDIVSSPTFSIVNEYQSATESIFHFDLYRLDDENELYDFGIEEYLNSNAYLFIEWPKLLENLIDRFNYITIEIKTKKSRTLKMIKM